MSARATQRDERHTRGAAWSPSARCAPPPIGEMEEIDLGSGASGRSEEAVVRQRNLLVFEAMRNGANPTRREIRLAEEQLAMHHSKAVDKARRILDRDYIPPAKAKRREVLKMLFNKKYRDQLLKAAAKVMADVDDKERRKSRGLAQGNRPERRMTGVF